MVSSGKQPKTIDAMESMYQNVQDVHVYDDRMLLVTFDDNKRYFMENNEYEIVVSPCRHKGDPELALIDRMI